MSRAHREAFERTRREYESVVALVRNAPTKSEPDAAAMRNTLTTLTNAYALLLIVQAESFLRRYLVDSGVRLAPEPKLNNLINQAVRHFNATEPRVRIRPTERGALHELRERRNLYAHGYARRVFPEIATIAATLGRFFHNLPEPLPTEGAD